MSELNNLIPISYDNPERPTVSGRELHEFLQVKTAYKDWFPRMVEYGFTEGEDFNPLKIERVQDEGGRKVSRTLDDHQLTIPMAKELCMIQRNERGKQARQYFLAIEAQWNSPEAERPAQGRQPPASGREQRNGAVGKIRKSLSFFAGKLHAFA